MPFSIGLLETSIIYTELVLGGETNMSKLLPICQNKYNLSIPKMSSAFDRH